MPGTATSWWSRTLTGGSFAAVAFVSVALLWVVALPRFGALNEPPIPELYSYETAGGRQLETVTVDIREYLHATEYYAGDREAPEVAPFTYRLVIPFLDRSAAR